MEKIKSVTDAKLYELKQKGWSYGQIRDYYLRQGIEITRSAIQQRCKRVYRKREEEMPKTTKTAVNEGMRKVDPEEVFELREKRYTYNQMKDYFKEKGIDVSAGSLTEICKAIYKEKGLGRPKNGLPDSIRTYNEDEIISLRKKRWSYQKIADYVTKKYGEYVSYITIRRICKKAFEEKGEEEKRALRVYTSKITDNEIIELRRKGYSFMQMREYFQTTGREICRNRLFERARKIFGKDERGRITSVDIRTADKEIVMNALHNLKNTKGATDEQIKIIGNYYGLDFNNSKEISPYSIYDLSEKEL